MALIAISGEPGCRQEELASLVAQRLDCALVTESALDRSIAREFGDSIPGRAWPAAAAFVLMAQSADLVVCCPGAGLLNLPNLFRLHLVAPESVRVRNLMAESSRAEAKNRLRKLFGAQSGVLKQRFGLKMAPVSAYDLVLNEQKLEPAAMVDLLIAALRSQQPATEEAVATAQFQVRMQLARYGLVPPEQAQSDRKAFGHPSEEVFANLLDFYRIAWDYEPRSFPLQWDKDGKVSEAFTPDFYLPEFDLYVELTTMKQANVTKKNRKIRLLRAIYPHVNIQVFYQKDVQDLVMKYRPHQNA
ncbi:MAG TPA: hypothetical protein VFW44_06355 [Bryobacteraceae bacterium]|nr:hypothetical protein [Bryobacteraceae bacterium]